MNTQDMKIAADILIAALAANALNLAGTTDERVKHLAKAFNTLCAATDNPLQK